METIILTNKYQELKKEAIEKIKTYQNYTSTHKKFEIGQIIQFYGGYNNDILYQTEILGFNGDKLYVLWDCYWFSIADDNVRQIKLIN